MQKILVTGANGQLGSEFRDLAASYDQFEFIFCTKEELDITNATAVETYFREHSPSFCVHAAAYTAVDLAETEELQAFTVNADGTANIAAASARFNCRLVHISTDYVFDGSSKRPYVEEDVVAPLNAYGRSKLEGEKVCMLEDPQSVIIRTSWVYSAHGKNFVKTMKRLLQEKEEIGVVADQYGSPTYAKDLAQAIMQIIVSGKWLPGIYHYANSGAISWFDFAGEIKRQISSACLIKPLRTEEYPVKAVRPRYSVMNTDKIVTSYHVQIKDWKNSLSACLERLRD